MLRVTSVMFKETLIQALTVGFAFHITVHVPNVLDFQGASIFGVKIFTDNLYYMCTCKLDCINQFNFHTNVAFCFLKAFKERLKIIG